jgi:hypothetical protein
MSPIRPYPGQNDGDQDHERIKIDESGKKRHDVARPSLTSIEDVPYPSGYAAVDELIRPHRGDGAEE